MKFQKRGFCLFPLMGEVIEGGMDPPLSKKMTTVFPWVLIPLGGGGGVHRGASSGQGGLAGTPIINKRMIMGSYNGVHQYNSTRFLIGASKNPRIH